MSTKNRTKFAVAGIHPLLSLVRDHFIKKGFALVPWEEEPDFCLIGAKLQSEEHPPVAQLELQKMQVADKPVVLLSSGSVYVDSRGEYPYAEHHPVGYTVDTSVELKNSVVYSLVAENIFAGDNTLILRPFNVYGPDITWDIIHDTIQKSKRGEQLSHGNRFAKTTFIHQDDFLEAVYKLVTSKMAGVYNVGTLDIVSYGNLFRNIWKFIYGSETEPFIDFQENPHPILHSPNVNKLISFIGQPHKKSLRAGLFEMVKS